MLRLLVAGLAGLAMAPVAWAQGVPLRSTTSHLFDVPAWPAQSTTQGTTQAQEQPGRRRGLYAVWREHPSLRVGRNFRADFQAKFQWDANRPGDDPADFDPFRIRRARVGIDVEIFRHIQLSLERELRESEITEDPNFPGESQWKDAYVDVDYTNAAQVRVGKFKIPFGLDQLTSAANNDFIFRSLGTIYLTPARDVGATVRGRFFRRGLNYWVGVFKQDGDNARSGKVIGADETVAVRVTGTPLRRWSVAGLGQAEVGGGMTVSALSDDSELPNGLRGRTFVSKYVLFSPVFVNGTRRRMGVDVDWLLGPAGIRAEYTEVRDTRRGQSLANQDLADARARAWYVSGAWVVTGEKKDRPVEPREGGLPQGGAGAIEVVARIERLWFDSVSPGLPALRNPRARTILASGQHAFTAGVNWYVNRWTKLQLQSMREQPQDPERSPVVDGGAFWSTVFRLQLTM